MILDSILLLAVCIPVMLFARGPLQSCGFVMFGSFVAITGYERITGGYAVNGFYILADLGSAAALSALLLRGWSRAALTILLGYWIAIAIHGLKLITDPSDLNLYWWALRIVNACQLLILGGAGVFGGGGKRGRWRDRVRHGGGRQPVAAVAHLRGGPDR